MKTHYDVKILDDLIQKQKPVQTQEYGKLVAFADPDDNANPCNGKCSKCSIRNTCPMSRANGLGSTMYTVTNWYNDNSKTKSVEKTVKDYFPITEMDKYLEFSKHFQNYFKKTKTENENK